MEAKRVRFGVKSFALVAFALAVLVPLALTRVFPFLTGIEIWVADYRLSTAPQAEPQHPEIIIVGIDENTLKRFPYRSPVDRAFLAKVLRDLAAKGVKAIVLDVLLDQPTEPAKDDDLARTLRELPVPVVVSFAQQAEGLTDEQAQYLADYVPPDLRAFANLAKDSHDGTVRWVFFGKDGPDGTFVKGMVPAMAAKLGHPVDAPAALLPIAWRTPPDAKTDPFKQYPAHAVGVLPAPWFKGKIAMVGADLSDRDRHLTPRRAAYGSVAGQIPGVVIHAHALAQLLEDRQPPMRGIMVELVTLAVIAALSALLGSTELSLAVRSLAGVALIGALWAVGPLILVQANILIPQVGPSLSVPIAFWLTDIYKGLDEKRQRRFVQTAFSGYLSPAVMNEILRHPETLTMEPKRRELSFIFTDVAGFTTLSEGMDPAVLADTINRYLGGMADAIFEYGGIVDKFIGDAVFAIFNAPQDQPDHAERAVRCALAADRFARSFEASEAAAGRAFGNTRIGVHTGVASIGNFGSLTRFEYTALGDAVNTASRMEGVNKFFGTSILVSDATASQCPGLPFLPVANTILKGKNLPTMIWTPAGDVPDDLRDGYRAAFDLLDTDPAAALAAFADLDGRFPDQPLVLFHLERLRNGATGTLVIVNEK